MRTFLFKPLPILSIGISGNGFHELTGNDGKISSKGFPSDFLFLRRLFVISTISSIASFSIFFASFFKNFVSVLALIFSFSFLDCTSCCSCYLKKKTL